MAEEGKAERKRDREMGELNVVPGAATPRDLETRQRRRMVPSASSSRSDMENPHLDYREPPRPAAVESALDKSKVSTALKSMGHTAEEAISVEDVPVPRPTREPRYRKEPTPGTTLEVLIAQVNEARSRKEAIRDAELAIMRKNHGELLIRAFTEYETRVYNEVVVEHLYDYPVPLRGDTFHISSLLTLANEGGYLDDTCIRAYCNMVYTRSLDRADLPQCVITDTRIGSSHSHWTDKVETKFVDNYAAVVDNCKYFMIPVHVSIHWYAMIYDLENKTCTVYDSMPGTSRYETCHAEHTRLINKILNKNRQMNYLPPAEPLEFKLDVYTRVGKDGDGRPIQLWQQLDGCSCGVYTLRAIETVARGKLPFIFPQTIPLIRKAMTIEILTQRLIFPYAPADH